MAPIPKRTRLIRGMLACGWTKTDWPKTSKYACYFSPITSQVALVGPDGAMRILPNDQTPISQSTSVTDGIDYRALIEIGHPGQSFANPEEARAGLALAMERLLAEARKQRDAKTKAKA